MPEICGIYSPTFEMKIAHYTTLIHELEMCPQDTCPNLSIFVTKFSDGRMEEQEQI